MDSHLPILSLATAAVAGTAAAVPKLRARLALSRAKHRSLTGHAKISRLVARLIPFYEFDIDGFFGSDGAPATIATQRQDGFFRLASLYRDRFAKGRALTLQASERISDLQFTESYRVPFQYSRLVREHLGTSAFVQSSAGVTVTDLDGNVAYDLTGSYGVNIFGNDFYKDCIAERGRPARMRSDRCSGPITPSSSTTSTGCARFPVSTRSRSTCRGPKPSCRRCGSRAITPAARIWFVSPAPITAGGATCSPASAIRSRRTRPIRWPRCRSGRCGSCRQGATSPACWSIRCRRCIPTATRRRIPRWRTPRATAASTARPTAEWLKALRQVCTERNIVLIFDEVFVGFRLAAGGAQEYFGVRADMVTYGKSLAGGLPVGVVCGRRELMRRFRDNRPVDVCFARGTFNSHPYVMAAMDEFLTRLADPAFRSVYDGLDERWNERARQMNEALAEHDLPVRLSNLSSIWMVHYTSPSRYNWMFQYYLRAEGLALSWVGTGRLIFSLNYTDADFSEVTKRFVAAGKKMKEDGWWWHDAALTNKKIRRQILKEMVTRRRR